MGGSGERAGLEEGSPRGWGPPAFPPRSVEGQAPGDVGGPPGSLGRASLSAPFGLWPQGGPARRGREHRGSGRGRGFGATKFPRDHSRLQVRRAWGSEATGDPGAGRLRRRRAGPSAGDGGHGVPRFGAGFTQSGPVQSAPVRVGGARALPCTTGTATLPKPTPQSPGGRSGIRRVQGLWLPGEGGVGRRDSDPRARPSYARRPERGQRKEARRGG